MNFYFFELLTQLKIMDTSHHHQHSEDEEADVVDEPGATGHKEGSGEKTREEEEMPSEYRSRRRGGGTRWHK